MNCQFCAVFYAVCIIGIYIFKKKDVSLVFRQLSIYVGLTDKKFLSSPVYNDFIHQWRVAHAVTFNIYLLNCSILLCFEYATILLYVLSLFDHVSRSNKTNWMSRGE